MRYIIGVTILGFVFMLVTGCGDITLSSESKWTLGKGPLSAQVGDADRSQTNSDWPSMQQEERVKKAGFSNQTGQWFLYNGNGKLGYGIPGGTLKSGDEIAFSVSSPSGAVQIDRDARIQFIEQKHSDEEQVIIADTIIHLGTINKDEQIFSMLLPDVENTSYLFSVEILSDAGVVEDTLVSLIQVPAQEMNAALKTDLNTYSSSNSIAKLITVNSGPTTLFLGKHYTIEKKIDDSWCVVPLDTAFEDIGLYVSPDEEYEQFLDISELGKGQYRAIKNVRAEGTELSADLAVEFTVE